MQKLHAHDYIKAKRYRKYLTIAMLSLTIAGTFLYSAFAYQDFLYSFHTTREAQLAKLNHNQPKQLPAYKILIVKTK